MMIPVVAIVGRPNVGKSTLFNRLTRSKNALVADLPGVTRDRIYGEAMLGHQKVILIDTGGIAEQERDVDSLMAQQTESAIVEADTILFVVDAKAGATSSDQLIASKLREAGKAVLLVINKTDGMDEDVAVADFYQFGIQEMLAISAEHKRGMHHLERQLLAHFPKQVDDQQDEEEDADGQGIKVAIVGRPNVGKSTLVNRLLGEERVVVFDEPGTTRDSVSIELEKHGKQYTLIDTAGVRRKGKIDEDIEKFSVVKSLQSIESADVIIFMVNAREGITDQDLNLLGFVLESGRAMVIAINKWDGMDDYERGQVQRELERRLGFLTYVRRVTISALHGTGVGHLFEYVNEAYDCAMTKFPTAELTKLVQDAVIAHPPPLVQGRRIKLRYAHLGGSKPPRVIIHGNQTDSVPNAYIRYLMNVIRKAYKLVGTPIKIEFKGSDNPYAGKKNQLSERQQRRRQRMIRHIKKNEKKRKQK